MNLNFDKVFDKIKENVIREVALSGQAVIKEAVKIVPRDLGDLQDSIAGDINKDTLTGPSDDGLTYTIGSSLPYAFVQHEDLTFMHPSLERRRKYGLTDDGRQAKYLEHPLNELRDEIEKNILEAAREALK